MMNLKNVLTINALSSGATGFGLIVSCRVVAEIFDVPSTSPFIYTGIFLIAFAAIVFAESRRNPHSATMIKIITFLDLSWVMLSLILIFLPTGISFFGNAVVVLVALWVALMAALQINGLKKLIA